MALTRAGRTDPNGTAIAPADRGHAADGGPPRPAVPPRFAFFDDDGRPLLTDEQIASYDWATHTITVQPAADLDIQVKEGQSLVHGVPFTVVADGVACYRGAVTTCLSSFSQSVPVIDLHRGHGNKDEVRIELGYPSPAFFKGDDLRGDQRIRAALRAAGKLREPVAGEARPNPSLAPDRAGGK